METNTNEPLIKCRKRRNAIKTRGESLIWDKSSGNLLIGWTMAGMEACVNVALAFAWNVGTCRSDVKGAIQAEDP